MTEYYKLKQTFYRDLLGATDFAHTKDYEKEYLNATLGASFNNWSTGKMMFHYLGTLGATGSSLADRWHVYLTNIKGYSGSLRGMQKQFFNGGSF